MLKTVAWESKTDDFKAIRDRDKEREKAYSFITKVEKRTENYQSKNGAAIFRWAL